MWRIIFILLLLFQVTTSKDKKKSTSLQMTVKNSIEMDSKNSTKMSIKNMVAKTAAKAAVKNTVKEVIVRTMNETNTTTNAQETPQAGVIASTLKDLIDEAEGFFRDAVYGLKVLVGLDKPSTLKAWRSLFRNTYSSFKSGLTIIRNTIFARNTQSEYILILSALAEQVLYYLIG